MQRPFKDHAGLRYGRLLVTGLAPRTRNIQWECLCDCGETTIASSSNLVWGNTTSCGCYLREIIAAGTNVIHGEAKGGTLSAEYHTYSRAKQRCTNPKIPTWKYYGGRGIKFNFHSLEEFIKCVGRKPSKNHSLDRYPNNDGNYEPGNVRWATKKEQASNRCKRGEADIRLKKSLRRAELS